MNKIGTVIVSVFKSDTTTSFTVETDDENLLSISYIIEDTLKSY